MNSEIVSTKLQAVLALVLIIVAYTLFVIFAGWKIALAIFILHWGINIEHRLKSE